MMPFPATSAPGIARASHSQRATFSMCFRIDYRNVELFVNEVHVNEVHVLITDTRASDAAIRSFEALEIEVKRV